VIDRRFNVHEAASILGITPEAVRARIQRGTLPKEKDTDGAVYVRLNADQLQPNGDETGAESPTESADPALVGALQERIEHLSKIIDTRDEEIRRRDTIIMAMTQRIPELEAAPEPRADSEADSEGTGRGEVASEPQESVERRSWLHRFFFGPG
jgi:hypothetical protein